MKKIISLALSFLMVISVFAFAVNPAFAESFYNDCHEYYDYDISEEYYPIYIGEDTVKLSSYYADVFEISLYNNAKKRYDYFGRSKRSKKHNSVIKIDKLKSGTVYKVAAERISKYSYESDERSYFKIVTLPAKCELKSVKSAGNGKLNVTWKNAGRADGYTVICSTKKSFSYPYCKVVNVPAGKSSAQVSNLMSGKYYVAVKPFVKFNNARYYASKSNSIAVEVSSNVTVKSEINRLKLAPDAVKNVKKITKNGVDISKCKTGYDKVKAVYNWHAKHFKDFSDCVACNTSFNECICAMFDDSSNKEFVLQLQAGEVRNNDGSQVIHKWSMWYISGKPFLFDPRLQGYTGNFTGDLYFAKSTSSYVFKKVYIPQYTYHEYHLGGKAVDKYNFIKNYETQKLK